MALVWKLRNQKRMRIKDEHGRVVCIAVAMGNKSNPCKKILFLRPTEAQRRRGRGNCRN
jgi:hypothetical protein